MVHMIKSGPGLDKISHPILIKMQVLCYHNTWPEILFFLCEQETAKIMNITGYNIKCLPFEEMINDIFQGGIQCDIAIGAITLNTERMQKGIIFTFPTYRSSLGVLVSAKYRHGRTWSFLTPMDWTVWLAITITALVLPIIVFMIESWSVHGFVDTDDVTSGFAQALFDSVAMILNFGNFVVKSVEGRLVVIGYGFLVLILVNTYVANLTAFLTLSHIKSSIKEIKDLPGKKVASGGGYVRALRGRGILASKTFGSAQKESMIDELVEGSNFHALLYDAPWVRYQANQNCTIIPFVETVVEFDYAFALPRRLKAAKKNLSTTLLLLQETGVMERLDHRFVDLKQTKRNCPSIHKASVTDPVYFDQLVGLWIILAICMGISFTIALVRWGNAARKALSSEMDSRSVGKMARKRTLVVSEYHPHATLSHAKSLERAKPIARGQSVVKNSCQGGTCCSAPSGCTFSSIQETNQGFQDIRALVEEIMRRVPQQIDTIQIGVDSLNKEEVVVNSNEGNRDSQETNGE